MRTLSNDEINDMIEEVNGGDAIWSNGIMMMILVQLLDTMQENERLRNALSIAGNIMPAEGISTDFIEEALSNKESDNG